MSLAKAQRMAERMLGLNLYARSLVNSAKQEKSGKRYHGMGISYFMNQYTLADGRVYYEQVQVERGEVGDRAIFVALRDEKGAWVPESLWNSDSMFLADL